MRLLKRFLIMFLIPLVLAFGWGDKGHKLITKHSLSLLPAEIKLSDELKKEIVLHSVDPDYRKKHDPSESLKHYIDIDFYKEFLDGRMIHSKDSLMKIYGDEEIAKQGILPWATEETYLKLVEAFKNNNRDKIILYAADLAHYVEDGHQPQHATMNHNGQFTNQINIHFRYEIDMVNIYLPQLEAELKNIQPVYIKNRMECIFDYLTESHFYVDLILSADKSSYERSGKKYDEDYFKYLWFRTKYVTINEFNSGAYDLACLIYSAWIDAGKPELNL
jgi:hypothetical protein